MSPGSMPADSRELFQEGLVIPPLRLLREGEFVDDVLDLILANVRTPDIRRGDLRAQIAANRLAEQRLDELIERRGREEIEAVFSEVIDYTERRTRETLDARCRTARPRRRARSRATASRTPTSRSACAWRSPATSW